jgi:hypothetical protein
VCHDAWVHFQVDSSCFGERFDSVTRDNV